MNEFEKVLREEFIERNSRKIKDETLNEYFSSFKRADLMQCVLVPLITDRTDENLELAQKLVKQSKKEIIKYIESHIEYIVKSYIIVFSKKEINALKEILSYEGVYKFYEMPFTLLSIDRVRQSGLVYFEYNKEEDTILFNIQSDIKEKLKEALNNKELIRLNAAYNEVYTMTTKIVDAYGIVELETIHQIFEKLMYEIDYAEFADIITSKTITDHYKIHNYDGKYILGNVEFIDFEVVKDFYSKRTGDYKIFTKDEYDELASETYIEHLKPYEKLIKYLRDNYEGIDEDLEEIKILIIMDYIYTAQKDKKLADKEFLNNIDEVLDVDSAEKNYLLTLVQEIFDVYPKWIKRGNI